MCITATATFDTRLSAVSILHVFPQKRNCFGKIFSPIRTKRRTLRGQRRETERFPVKRVGFSKTCYSCSWSVHRYRRSRPGRAETRAMIRIELRSRAQTDRPPSPRSGNRETLIDVQADPAWDPLRVSFCGNLALTFHFSPGANLFFPLSCGLIRME